VSDPVVAALRGRLGGDLVSTEPALLDTRRHDYWVRAHLDDLQARPAPRPRCVVRPRSTEDVVACVEVCRDARIAMIPFGLGSGVCGGIEGHPERVLIDLSTLDRTRFVDDRDLLAGFDAGRRGSEAEADVARQGLTIGHWPQSVAVSSVGGWVATRASGQFSTANGNIEDIVYSIEAVLADGRVLVAGKAPRAAAGPDLRHVLLGSEGTLGIVTGVTLSLRRRPDTQQYSAYSTPTLTAGFDFQRAVVQAGWAPPVMRQYDAVEALRSFADHAVEGRGILILVHEGPAARVAAELDAVDRLAREHGLGRVDAAATASWMDHRNTVPHWSGFLEKRIVVDTVEVSAPWSRIAAVYDGAIAALRRVPDVINASAHSSHVYRSGLNLYFSFAARPAQPADMADRYRRCWEAILEATVDAGGGVAHHHGIGRVRRDWLRHDLGDAGIATLRALKRALDPDGLFNPGVLLPDS
jgi:alkyldihydroxyacetonephosphate synthase